MASGGAHVMLSYQWDIQEIVEQVYNHLIAMGMPVWMDIKGGMGGNINDAMAAGVDGAAVVCPFMTEKYQESKNCKKELNYADSEDKVIVPVMAQEKYKATAWLGLITAGALWTDFRKADNMQNRVESLAKEIIAQGGSLIKLGVPKPIAAAKGAAAKPAPKVNLQKQPGRAFKHAVTGMFLAETGQVKFHKESGSRSSLATVAKAEPTSYWVEIKKKDSDIRFFQNYSTKGYLGYDPNGDYMYTKGQHYGAEEWRLVNDETDKTGKRAVVLWAVFGKKYLAIRNNKFTGVSDKKDDCKWYLE